jgi:hypothetical protein
MPEKINHSSDADLSKDGPWLTLALKCRTCGHEWVGESHFSGRGLECPSCSSYQHDFSWLERAMQEEGKE